MSPWFEPAHVPTGAPYSPSAIERGAPYILLLGVSIKVASTRTRSRFGGCDHLQMTRVPAFGVSISAAYSSDMGGRGGVTGPTAMLGNAEQLTSCASDQSCGRRTTGVGYDIAQSYSCRIRPPRSIAAEFAVGASSSRSAYSQTARTSGVDAGSQDLPVWASVSAHDVHERSHQENTASSRDHNLQGP